MVRYRIKRLVCSLSPIVTSGKECSETFWLNISSVRSFDAYSDTSSETDHMSEFGRFGLAINSRSQMRLIEWSVKSLTFLIKKIIVHRRGSRYRKRAQEQSLNSFRLDSDKTFFDEVAQIIELPPPNGVDIENTDLDDVDVDHVVIRELRELVGRIAAMYNDNPFHNFEHASHVTLSIIKLLSRIVKPSDQEDDELNTSYGITSDPLTQFACCFSSLIHDLVRCFLRFRDQDSTSPCSECKIIQDHPGVFNSQLSKENPVLSERYKHRSVAEQNSLELGLELFTSETFANLRAVLFETSEDQERFRQLVVNSVGSYHGMYFVAQPLTYSQRLWRQTSLTRI